MKAALQTVTIAGQPCAIVPLAEYKAHTAARFSGSAPSPCWLPAGRAAGAGRISDHAVPPAAPDESIPTCAGEPDSSKRVVKVCGPPAGRRSVTCPSNS